MKFSTKAEYGIKALIALAAGDKGSPYSLPQIAREQKIPRAYLEQLFARLKKAGLVESKKGVKGGYKLKVNPQDITVFKIVSALEDNFSPYMCAGENDAACANRKDCLTKNVWIKVQDSVNQTLHQITLKDLVKQ